MSRLVDIRTARDLGTVLIQAVTLEEDGMSINYSVLPTDVRVDGHVSESRTLMVGRGRYGDEIDALEAHLRRFLIDVIEDFEESPPWDGLDDDEDDDKGMGE